MRIIACHDDEADNREKKQGTRWSLLESGPESSSLGHNFWEHGKKKDRPRRDTGRNGQPSLFSEPRAQRRVDRAVPATENRASLCKRALRSFYD